MGGSPVLSPTPLRKSQRENTYDVAQKLTFVRRLSLRGAGAFRLTLLERLERNRRGHHSHRTSSRQRHGDSQPSLFAPPVEPKRQPSDVGLKAVEAGGMSLEGVVLGSNVGNEYQSYQFSDDASKVRAMPREREREKTAPCSSSSFSSPFHP